MIQLGVWQPGGVGGLKLALQRGSRAWNGDLTHIVAALPKGSAGVTAWRLQVMRWAALHPTAPDSLQQALRDRVLVIDVRTDAPSIQPLLDMWWAADVSFCVHVRIWDHEGCLLDDDPENWDPQLQALDFYAIAAVNDQLEALDQAGGWVDQDTDDSDAPWSGDDGDGWRHAA